MTPFYFFELPFIMPIQTNLLLLYFLVYTAAKATGTQPKIWEDAKKSRSYTIVDFNTAYGIIRSPWGRIFLFLNRSECNIRHKDCSGFGTSINECLMPSVLFNPLSSNDWIICLLVGCWLLWAVWYPARNIRDSKLIQKRWRRLTWLIYIKDLIWNMVHVRKNIIL